jgi:hypothetical protein
MTERIPWCWEAWPREHRTQLPWPRCLEQTQHMFSWLEQECEGECAVVMHYVYFELKHDMIRFKLTWC